MVIIASSGFSEEASVIQKSKTVTDAVTIITSSKLIIQISFMTFNPFLMFHSFANFNKYQPILIDVFIDFTKNHHKVLTNYFFM